MDGSSTGSLGNASPPVYTRNVSGRERKVARDDSSKPEASSDGAAEIASARASSDASLIASAEKLSVKLTGRRTDVVEFSSALDLRLGQEMLQSAIGRKIDALFEKHGVDLDAHADRDMSVEATSKRIFDFAVGMFEIYKKQHPELDEETAKGKFETEIRNAVKDGYDSAIEVLKGMQVSDQVLAISQQTYDAIDKLFEDYFHPKSEDDEEGAAAESSDDATPSQANASPTSSRYQASISDMA